MYFYSNSRLDNYLCFVNYNTIESILIKKNIQFSEMSGSKKLIFNKLAKQILIDHFQKKTSKLNPIKTSFSHGVDRSVMLINNNISIYFVGVDIEYVDNTRPARFFLTNYIKKYVNAIEVDSADCLFSTIIFSCMESLYKALCSVCPFTFNIEDYIFLARTKDYCVFNYAGNIKKFKHMKFFCNYYFMDSFVISVSLLDSSLKSQVVGGLLRYNLK